MKKIFYALPIRIDKDNMDVNDKMVKWNTN